MVRLRLGSHQEHLRGLRSAWLPPHRLYLLPYGQVTAEGDVVQPMQWSSEFNDSELALTYYNYRHYNPVDGRWMCRDKVGERTAYNLYQFANNNVFLIDYIGLVEDRYIFCDLLEETAFGWGDKKRVGYYTSLSFLGFPILVTEVYERPVNAMFCKFRCWKAGRDNCYKVPCSRHCTRDHGTEITVRMRSTHRNIATKFCKDIEPEVRAGTIDGGARITRNYK